MQVAKYFLSVEKLYIGSFSSAWVGTGVCRVPIFLGTCRILPLNKFYFSHLWNVIFRHDLFDVFLGCSMCPIVFCGDDFFSIIHVEHIRYEVFEMLEFCGREGHYQFVVEPTQGCLTTDLSNSTRGPLSVKFIRWLVFSLKILKLRLSGKRVSSNTI